jgi:hypothetical protein
MSYNDNINNIRLNNSINYIITNQNIMFDLITSLRNSINYRSRSARPNYTYPRNTMPTTPSPPAHPLFNMNSTTTPTANTEPTPLVNRLRNIEISLTEPFNSQLFNSIFNSSETEEPSLSLSNLLENTELSVYRTDGEETICAICRADIQDNAIIRKINGCGHSFHHNCLDNWLKNHHTCPICRQSLRTNTTTPPSSTTRRTEGSIL